MRRRWYEFRAQMKGTGASVAAPGIVSDLYQAHETRQLPRGAGLLV